MITGINESRTLTNHISCKCECKFDDRKRNLNQNWNKNKCRCEYKNGKVHQCGKSCFQNPANVAAKMVKTQEVLVIQ